MLEKKGRARLVGITLTGIVAGLVATGTARAQSVDQVGQGIVHAAAVAIFCSERTQGEVGAPVPVLMTYLDLASTKFFEHFGKKIGDVADFAAETKSVRSDPTWIAAANRDEWPPLCDTALEGLSLASRGDFAAWETPNFVPPPPGRY